MQLGPASIPNNNIGGLEKASEHANYTKISLLDAQKIDSSSVSCITFGSRCSSFFAVGFSSGKVIITNNTNDGRKVITPAGGNKDEELANANAIVDVSFSSRNNFLVSSSVDKVCHVYLVDKEKEFVVGMKLCR